MLYTYRIYTEDKRRDLIFSIARQTDCTITFGFGFFNRVWEYSCVIEFVGDESIRSIVRKIAEEVRFENKQKAVLLTISPVNEILIIEGKDHDTNPQTMCGGIGTLPSP